jgi:hypothetical protein
MHQAQGIFDMSYFFLPLTSENLKESLWLSVPTSVRGAGGLCLS